jgi:hypothetical protein
MARHLRKVWFVLDPVILLAGLMVHLVTKRTPHVAMLSLRRLFVVTDGRLNDASARVTGVLHPPRKLAPVEGVLGTLTAEDVDRLARQIDRDGFIVFDAKLSPDLCDRITEYALSTPAHPDGGERVALYDRANPQAARYEFDEQTIFGMPELQEMLADPSLLAVAESYLGCAPVNDLASLWWSPATGGGPSSSAAQLFHFDMDRFKFLKFFFYLSDVDSGRGPHVYVRGSHVRKPESLRRDGRIQDEEIADAYGADAITEITGARGSILAVDTRGFHKGKVPVAGDRLLLQFEFANSLFGAPYERVRVDDSWRSDVRTKVETDRRAFKRFEPAPA